MELKFKNSAIMNLVAAIIFSGAMVFMFVFGLILSSIVGQTEDNILALKIFGSIFLAIWVIYFVVTFLFYKTIVVTEEKITLKRRKKIIWSIDKDDIKECVYQEGYNIFSFNASTMLFKMKSNNKYATRKLNKFFDIPNSIVTTSKNVEKIRALGYKIKIINSIYEQ